MDKLTKDWQSAIIQMAEEKLGRKLNPAEQRFISTRLSYLALEFVEDAVRTWSSDEVYRYLNSEAG